MYRDEPLHRYLDDLASAQPAPGGGSASALCGAMGAALVSMVARLTLGKAKYADVQAEIEELLQETERLRDRFQTLMQEDIEAYGKLSAAFKLPRDTDEEIFARTNAVQTQLVEAALVPLAVVECAATLAKCCRRMAEIGNVNVLSDVATASVLASSAGQGAAWMVRVNVRSIKDLEMVSVLNDRLNKALEDISLVSQEVTDIIGRRA